MERFRKENEDLSQRIGVQEELIKKISMLEGERQALRGEVSAAYSSIEALKSNMLVIIEENRYYKTEQMRMPLDQSGGRIVARGQSLLRESQPSASQLKMHGQGRLNSSAEMYAGGQSFFR